MQLGSRYERTLAQKPSETCTTIHFTQVKIIFLSREKCTCVGLSANRVEQRRTICSSRHGTSLKGVPMGTL